MVIIVMGVTGSGKTTVGRRLAQSLGWRFHDADDFHPAANKAKMHAGIPLVDEDRWPWLRALRAVIEQALADHVGAVVTCSALKRAYRVTGKLELRKCNSVFGRRRVRLEQRVRFRCNAPRIVQLAANMPHVVKRRGGHHD